MEFDMSFSYVKSFFSHSMWDRTNPMDYGQKPGAEVKGKDEVQELYLKVHVWRTHGGEGRCGHTSTSLHQGAKDSKPKRYVGLWPHGEKNSFLLNHPFAYLFGSVLGEIHVGRKFCEMREGDDERMHPDAVYTIKIDQDQYDKIDTEMKLETKRVEEGQVLYSLFPKVNFVVSGAKFFANETVVRELMDSDFLEANPEVLESAAMVRGIRAEHCTTISKRILESGGFEIKESLFPWVVSPIQLDTQLSKFCKERDDISVELFEQPPKERMYEDDTF